MLNTYPKGFKSSVEELVFKIKKKWEGGFGQATIKLMPQYKFFNRAISAFLGAVEELMFRPFIAHSFFFFYKFYEILQKKKRKVFKKTRKNLSKKGKKRKKEKRKKWKKRAVSSST